MPEQLPVNFVDVISTSRGAAGTAWLAALPALISDVEAGWRIRVGNFYPNLSYHFVQSVLSAWWTFEENSENWRDGLAEAEIWDV